MNSSALAFSSSDRPSGSVAAAAVTDVAQDLFVIVHRKLDSLSSAAALRSWQFGIVRRVRRDRQPRVMRRQLGEVAGGAIEEIGRGNDD